MGKRWWIKIVDLPCESSYSCQSASKHLNVRLNNQLLTVMRSPAISDRDL
ncbi:MULTISPECIES: hypothetical protein [Chroococcidiopsis]|nr:MULTISPECIES: hypothetical protein [Chroococcidiopsis]MBE9016949.1 hypothetical protein [Chroococcidiopsidales cyanobacterium LEGE 13417]URD51147.1 hypothetical protein M5J74_03975 [Chroococcidiopsis sp. CCNUC1]